LNISLHSQQVKQLSHLEMIAKQVVEGFITGLHKSPFHGFSVEFAEHRLYNNGESTRHIDWKLYARTDKMFVKRYEEETNLRCQIVIDASSSMHYPLDAKKGLTKLKFSTYAAASLIHLLKKQRDAFGLSVFGDDVHLQTAAKSSNVHQKRLFSELEGLLDSERNALHTSSTAKALHQIAEAVHKRSLVIIFSDMLENSNKDQEDVWTALQHLRHNKHEVVVFHVVDRSTELDLEFDNAPHRFIDMETGQELKLNPQEVKKAYQDSMSKFLDELKLRCGQNRIDLVEADIAEGYTQVLLPYLLKRKRMF
jgi:uncharacterized protein (DUF58 family)